MTRRARLRGPVERHAILDSTNRLAARRAEEGGPEGLVVRADRQDHGRGRRDRTWHSPLGGLWFTILLRPPTLEGLSLAAGLACVRAVRRLGVDASWRWPNDVYVGPRKLAGILAEGRLVGSEVASALVGVGLNVNLGLQDFPEELQGLATSLALERGAALDPDEVLETVLDELDAVYSLYLEEGFQALLPELEATCSTLGRRVQVLTEQGTFAGRAERLGPEGALVLDDGTAFHSVERVRVLDEPA